MIRYRIVATTGHSAKSYTLHLVRYITDERAREIMHESKGAARNLIKGSSPVLVAYRETYHNSGFTKTKVEVGRLELSYNEAS